MKPMIDPRPPDASPSDPELVESIRGGDMSALGKLFDRYAEDVRRVASRMCASSDVDDIVQATFLDVLKASVRYDGRESARSWMLGLTIIQVRRHRRVLARLAQRLGTWAKEAVPTQRSPETDAADREHAERFERAYGALSDKKREVVVLVAIEGLSGDEAASLLNIPVATVWTRLHHARNELAHAVFGGER